MTKTKSVLFGTQWQKRHRKQSAYKVVLLYCIGTGPSCTVAGGSGAVEGEAHNVAERLSASSESWGAQARTHMISAVRVSRLNAWWRPTTIARTTAGRCTLTAVWSMNYPTRPNPLPAPGPSRSSWSIRASTGGPRARGGPRSSTTSPRLEPVCHRRSTRSATPCSAVRPRATAGSVGSATGIPPAPWPQTVASTTDPTVASSRISLD